MPVVEAMLRAYPACRATPTCTAQSAWPRRHAGADSRRQCSRCRVRMTRQEGILFIRRDNAVSLRAHEKMGMREVPGFAHGGAEMAVLAYVG